MAPQQFLSDFYKLASANQWRYYYFAGFDNEWLAPDDVEAHFGLFHRNLTMKEEFRQLSFLSAPSRDAVATTAPATPESESLAPPAPTPRTHCR
ncbi:hypothetical protein PINS_up006789 [Pythium insidiosum]|nr:hypothetical protein PINS_up006789 [Pythium insidiosum]